MSHSWLACFPPLAASQQRHRHKETAKAPAVDVGTYGIPSTAVTTFGFKTHGASDITHTIRVVDIAGNPWFVAADLCEILGYSRTDSMLRLLAWDERGITPRPVCGVDGKSRKHGTVSESGLYKLIMRSDKPQAKDFQNWVTRVVLPAIRKDGTYIRDEASELVLDHLLEQRYHFFEMPRRFFGFCDMAPFEAVLAGAIEDRFPRIHGIGNQTMQIGNLPEVVVVVFP